MNLMPALTTHPSAALLSALAALSYAVLAWAHQRMSAAQNRGVLGLAWLLHLAVLVVALLEQPARFGFAPALSVTAWLVLTVYAIESRLFPLLRARWTLAILGMAVVLLAARKIGALIAIEREMGTRSIQDTGTLLNSEVSTELLASIFHPGTPLHDGGVIISEERIAAAGCVFPLTQNDDLSRDLGTRHRAAIGVTEETDTLVVVVSEETGMISIAYNGRLKRGYDGPHLRRVLASFLGRESGLRQLARRRNGEENGQMSFIFGEEPNE